MSDSYVQFSTAIYNITDEEKTWIGETLSVATMAEDSAKFLCERLGGVEQNADDGSFKTKNGILIDVDCWPGFDYSVEMAPSDTMPVLWIHSEDQFNEEHLLAFLQAFFAKFRPTELVILNMAHTESRPKLGCFGGSVMAVWKDGCCGVNTWDLMSAIYKVHKMSMERDGISAAWNTELQMGGKYTMIIRKDR